MSNEDFMQSTPSDVEIFGAKQVMQKKKWKWLFRWILREEAKWKIVEKLWMHGKEVSRWEK